MASKITELLEKLPDDLREIAERYLPAFEGAIDADIKEWVALIVAGDWNPAYRFAIRKMSTDELVAEMNRVNVLLAGLNAANAEIITAQKSMMAEFLLALVTPVLGTATGN